MATNNLYVCGNPDCDYEIKQSDIKDFHAQVNICPTCSKERNLVSMLVTEAHYKKKERQRELAKRLYCRKCDKNDLIENFPFDFPDDPHKERICPRCGNDDNLVNMGTVPMCDDCDMRPVEKGHALCKCCRKQLIDAEEAALAKEEYYEELNDRLLDEED